VPDPDLFGAPKEGSLSNPQRLNRYSYCLNNPYRFIDPNGEAPYDWADAIDGFLSRTIFSEASKATASITMTPATAYVTESVIRGSYDFLRFGVGTYNAINGNNTLWETVGYVGQDVLRAAQVVAYVSIAAKGAGIIGKNINSELSFTEHGVNQSFERGFSPNRISRIIKEGDAAKINGRYGLQTKYTLGNNSVVIANEGRNAGKIITVFSDKTVNGIKGYWVKP
jgi:hypothetical protein